MSFKIRIDNNSLKHELEELKGEIKVELDTLKSLISDKTPEIFKIGAAESGVVYKDETIMFIWDGINKQPKYLIKKPPIGDWINGGINLIKDNYVKLQESGEISNKINTKYYFTKDGTRKKDFDLDNYGNMVVTWITSEYDKSYPTYYCRWIAGSVESNLTVIIEKF